MTDFVRAADTDVKAERSQAAIIAMLGRYGASGFGFRRRGDIAEVTFHLPRKDRDDQTVRIPVDVRAVLTKIIRMRDTKRARRKTPDMDQAERVSWRALLFWIEASMMAVQLGAQSMEEAFFAHLVVTTDDGQEGRLVEYVATLGLATGGLLPSSRRLLDAGKTEGQP